MPDKLFFLDASAGRVLAMNPDGSDRETIFEGRKRLPDGIDVDVDAGHLYWTYMGNPSANDGSIVRADLDGRNLTEIVPDGATFTPKQLRVEKQSRKLYWSDREGMRVMRANLDGSQIEVLVQTGTTDADRRDPRNWCVGIAVDPAAGKLYWTQKGGENAGQGRILRADLELPEGETPANRSDIEVLFDGLPEPIDLDLDLAQGVLYWTDRGDPPRGNTINRAPIDARLAKSTKPEVLFTHLMEGIGLALDLPGRRMFVTDLGGSVYSANLDGSNPKVLAAAQGNLTGIVYVALRGDALTGRVTRG
ncbi:MAG TPA: 3-hydroxyacyl-CoA dehydrogenase [Myxococcota bacterium]|nr:3-hydroxyacyl-CoA dehydrogenase [Myxococcota bacterium]